MKPHTLSVKAEDSARGSVEGSAKEAMTLPVPSAAN